MIYESRNFISGKPLTRKNTRKTKWPTLIRGNSNAKQKKNNWRGWPCFYSFINLVPKFSFLPFLWSKREEEKAWEWGCLIIGMIYLLILELAKAAAITFWLGLGDDGFLMHQLIDVVSEFALLMLYYKYYTCLLWTKKILNILFVRNITWWTQTYNLMFYV